MPRVKVGSRLVPLPPSLNGVEVDYIRALLPLVDALNKSIERMIVSDVDGWSTRLTREDDEARSSSRPSLSRAELGRIISARLKSIKIGLEEAWSENVLSGKVRTYGEATNRLNEKGFAAQWAPVRGVDTLKDLPGVKSRLEKWSTENAKLITKMKDEHIQKIAELTRDGLEAGRRPESLAKELRERYGMARRRAATIASDQLGKLNGDLTKYRQLEHGIESFQWMPQNDRRVRERHRILRGKVFTWKDGHPTEGYPGKPVRCRCVALPVFEDDDGPELLIAEGPRPRTPSPASVTAQRQAARKAPRSRKTLISVAKSIALAPLLYILAPPAKEPGDPTTPERFNAPDDTPMAELSALTEMEQLAPLRSPTPRLNRGSRRYAKATPLASGPTLLASQSGGAITIPPPPGEMPFSLMAMENVQLKISSPLVPGALESRNGLPRPPIKRAAARKTKPARR